MTEDVPFSDLDKGLKAVYEILLKAVTKGGHGFKIPVLASIDKEMCPRARRMVIRHFFQESREVVFYTDARSDKIDEFEHNNAAELALWSKQEGLQLRLQSRVFINSYQEFKDNYDIIPEIDGKKDYKTELAPGTEISQPDIALTGDEKQNFRALICKFHDLEWLYLGSDRNIRALIGWDSQGQINKRSFLVP